MYDRDSTGCTENLEQRARNEVVKGEHVPQKRVAPEASDPRM